jgi:hypothetical protein
VPITIPDICTELTDDAYVFHASQIDAGNMLSFDDIKKSQQLKEKYDNLLTLLRWLREGLKVECESQSDAVEAIVVSNTPSQVKQNSLLQKLYSSQAEDGETRIAFSVRIRAAFDAADISPIDPELPAPDVAKVCQGTARDALRKYESLSHEASDSLTYVSWLE